MKGSLVLYMDYSAIHKCSHGYTKKFKLCKAMWLNAHIRFTFREITISSSNGLLSRA